MTRTLFVWYGLYPAALNLALGGALGWWFYRFAAWVPIFGSAGALADTWIAAFLIPFLGFYFVSPGVERRVLEGIYPARLDPPGALAERLARRHHLLRATAFGALGLALVGAPVSLLLATLAPDPLTLPGFLTWKALTAAAVAGLVTPAIGWASLTSRAALVKAIPRFPVFDLRQAIEFYEQRLGFQKLFELRDYAGVGRSGFELHLFRTDDPKLPEWTSCRVNVRGVDSLYAECERAGVVHPNGPLTTQPWGFREFTVLDLCGNAIVFGEWVGTRSGA